MEEYNENLYKMSDKQKEILEELENFSIEISSSLCELFDDKVDDNDNEI